ncbi:MAG: DUF7133 domain-containing protein [Vicinamibacterales bacterium]
MRRIADEDLQRRLRWLIVAPLLAVVALSGLVAPVGGQAPPLADRFVLPDDLEITLWAESPMFFNPRNIDIDAKGRVWVAEAVNYRSFNTAKDAPFTHAAGDRILILSDTDADGRADTVKVFVQDHDLRAPLGLAVIGTRVVVSASPNLIVYGTTIAIRDAYGRPVGIDRAAHTARVPLKPSLMPSRWRSLSPSRTSPTSPRS